MRPPKVRSKFLHHSYRLALFLPLAAFPGLADGQSGTQAVTTTVTANPTTITVGGSVGVTATVQPNNVVINPGQAFAKPTGTITILDGNSPLNTPPTELSANINIFASASFLQTFGTPDAAILQAVPFVGELTEDLNGDGVPDLLIYSPTYNQTGVLTSFLVQSFVSNGKGGYSTGLLQTLSLQPVEAQVGAPMLVDLNGDGKLDLFVGGQVAYGNGDGTFAQPTTLSFLSSGFLTSYAADLNGDGKADIVAVNPLPYISGELPEVVQWTATVFLNDGGGSFTSAGTFPVSEQFFGAFSVGFLPPAFIDLNGDGRLDFVTQSGVSPMHGASSIYIDVCLNNGDGTFGSPIPVYADFTGTVGDYAMGSGDLNGNGKQDLILLSPSGILNTLLGNGDGTFQTPTTLTLANNAAPQGFMVEDVNLDGKLDLVFSDGQLVLGNGDGTFALGTALFTSPNDTSYPLVSMNVAGNPLASIVFLNLATPPPAAVFTPQTSSSAAISLSTLTVGQHTISVQYSGDAYYAAGTSAGIGITVNQAASAIAVVTSDNPVFAGQSVTLTANVTSNGPLPTGNVTFTSGSTTLGTVSVSGGSAAFTTSFNTTGAQTIVASYSGDVNNQASSATIGLTVNAAFTLEPSGVVTITVMSGQAVNTTINVTGVPGFSGQVSFACSGLPADATCAFNPATVAVSGPTVVPTSLTVNTAVNHAAALRIQDMGNSPTEAACGLGLSSLILLWLVRRRGMSLLTILGCLLVLTMLGLTGCGGSGTKGTAPGTYNFIVTASSGSVQVTSTYTLVVH